jgi:adenylate cyclase
MELSFYSKMPLKAKGKKDKSSSMLVERCEYFLKEQPPKDWDGVFTRTHK